MDRLVIKEDMARRLTDSVEIAANLSGGLVVVNIVGEDRDILFSQNYACEDCGISIEELSPRMFSFNNPFGACPTCTGLGGSAQGGPGPHHPQPRSLHSGGGHHRLGLEQRQVRLHLPHVFRGPGPEVQIQAEHPGEGPAAGGAGRHSLRHQGGEAEADLRPGQRPGDAVPGLRGRGEQPGAPLPGDSVRRDAPGAGGVHDRAALSRLRRQTTAEGGPGGHRGGHEHLHVLPEAGDRGSGLRGRAGALPPEDAHRRAHFEGDQKPAGLSPVGGPTVPDPEPGGRLPVRRREPAHPPGYPDRLLSDGGAVYSGRALHRPTPAGQRQATGHPQALAGPGQHPSGGGARRGHHARRPTISWTSAPGPGSTADRWWPAAPPRRS